MEKIKTEEAGRKRGRPKLDAHITEEYAPSRRQALNKMYMYEGVHLLLVAARPTAPAYVRNGPGAHRDPGRRFGRVQGTAPQDYRTGKS